MQYIELSPVAAFLLRVNIITVPHAYLLIGVGMLQSYPCKHSQVALIDFDGGGNEK